MQCSDDAHYLVLYLVLLGFRELQVVEYLICRLIHDSCSPVRRDSNTFPDPWRQTVGCKMIMRSLWVP